ncbi:hypothetical protein GGTG_13426 [Gaeumannomyces tritici R3-111a-1]|uniref:Uncharacterized protein n=1 Tax=Gaeumannomyces tritici (strain R3-111a-1) TaxID=644352 RepID=J3PIU6_GAET3|nr:hypothetical protein GGTG_13426 [Gaeumannomyces tritici R3-111a-1]EJT69029.1 hypothetical protein GGTG_13426 [Gaeumannomyces tritici R3-111a-1]
MGHVLRRNPPAADADSRPRLCPRELPSQCREGVTTNTAVCVREVGTSGPLGQKIVRLKKRANLSALQVQKGTAPTEGCSDVAGLGVLKRTPSTPGNRLFSRVHVARSRAPHYFLRDFPHAHCTFHCMQSRTREGGMFPAENLASDYALASTHVCRASWRGVNCLELGGKLTARCFEPKFAACGCAARRRRTSGVTKPGRTFSATLLSIALHGPHRTPPLSPATI